MKRLLFLLVIASTPCIAGAYCLKHSDNFAMVASESLRLADYRTLEFNGTIEKHLTKDVYQFIDKSGRVLAQVDGDVWRAQNVTERNGILIIS